MKAAVYARALAVLAVVACSDRATKGPKAAAEAESDRSESEKSESATGCQGSGCDDAPSIDGSEILFAGSSLARPGKIAVAGDALVFAQPHCCLSSMPRSGGPVTRLVTRTIIADFAVRDDWVYYIANEEGDGPDRIRRVPLDGSRGGALIGELPAGHVGAAIAARGKSVFVVANDVDPESLTTRGRYVHRLSLNGQKLSSSSLASSPDKPVLAVAGTRVLLALGRVLFEIDDGANTSRAGGAGASIRALAVRGDDVYRATSRTVTGPKLEPGDGELIYDLAVSDTHVYWIDGYTIVAKPLAGGEPEVVARYDESPMHIAAADDAIYWSVPYTYAPGAKTAAERVRTQRGGFIARTPAPGASSPAAPSGTK